MGTWEVGLYQNDTSSDVRDEYIGKLKAGKSDEEALQEILCEYKEESEDYDEKYDFYLGLADTMWKKGRLTDEIKEKALLMLEEDKISDRWQSDKIRKERVKVLNKLKEKWEGPMPERKKIPIHKPYKLNWQEGEVYCFQISGRDVKQEKALEEYTGWYAMFYVQRIYLKDWQVRGIPDELADIFFFLRKEKPESPSDILSSTGIRFSRDKSQNCFKACICESSKRQRPKDMRLLGKMENFPYLQTCNREGYCFGWNLGERDIIWGYRLQKEYEAEMEKS